MEVFFQEIDRLIRGVIFTVGITAVSYITGLCLSLVFLYAYFVRTKVVVVCIRWYVLVFRGTPLLMQLYLLYYGVGSFTFLRSGWAWDLLSNALFCAVFVFTLNTAAYLTKIFQGYLSKMNDKIELSAQSLSLSNFQIFQSIIIPNVIRGTWRCQCNEAIFTLHGTALASMITVQDTLGVIRILNTRYYLNTEGLLIAAFIYLVLTWLIIICFRLAESHI